MNTTRAHGRITACLTAVAVVLLLLGCGTPPWQEPVRRLIFVTNRTATPLTFRTAVEDREVDLLGPIQPGTTNSIFGVVEPIVEGRIIDARGCTKAVVTAYDPDGREVASHPPWLCVGETWIIEPE